jgi:rod shape-determining protein MreC
VLTAGPYAKAQLITDRAAGVGAMILRTRRQGVVRGSGRGSGGLELDYVPLQADVRPGDFVITAGIDGVYPRGIPIGTVVSVAPGGQLFHKIQLAPAVDFGALDQVYLLEYEPVPPDLKEAAPDVRP